MIVGLEDGSFLAGEALVRSVLRSGLTPIPMTFEAWIKVDADNAPMLLEGKVLKVGRNATPVLIHYVADGAAKMVHGGTPPVVRHIIALHQGTAALAHLAQKGCFLENSGFQAALHACGAGVTVSRDMKISRFYCPKGRYPSVQIQQICQENAAVCRWQPEGDSVGFWRIADLFEQSDTVDLGGNDEGLTKKSGFRERVEIPAYVSTTASGDAARGDFGKARKVLFSPDKTPAQLRAMSRVLVNAKNMTMEYSPSIHAGAAVKIGRTVFVVINAAHEFGQTEFEGENSRTTLWLGVFSGG